MFDGGKAELRRSLKIDKRLDGEKTEKKFGGGKTEKESDRKRLTRSLMEKSTRLLMEKRL
jgi:hypothetical protein